MNTYKNNNKQKYILPCIFVGVLLVFGALLGVLFAKALGRSTVGNLITNHHNFNLSEVVRPIYNGGFVFDEEVFAVEGSSVRVDADTADWYGFFVPYQSDLTTLTMSFMIRVEDWSSLEKLRFIINTTDSTFQNYYSFDILDHFSSPEDNEWLRVVLSPADFLVASGSPEWSRADSFVLRVAPQDGKTSRVWFDDFILYQAPTNYSSMVSITFDDGFSSVHDAALAELQKRNMLASAYIIPDFINGDNYLNQEELGVLVDAGWDIGAHSAYNLRKLSSNARNEELLRVQHAMASLGVNPPNIFAYPNGSYSEAVQADVARHYAYSRTIDGFIQSTGRIQPLQINAITVSSDMSAEDVVEIISKASEHPSWLILVWHDVVEGSPQRDVEFRLGDFTSVLDYIQSQNNLEVITVSSGIDMLSGYIAE